MSGTLVVSWLLFSIAVGIAAKNRGRDGGGWFFLSLCVSPLVGAVFLFASKNLAREMGVLPNPKTQGLCPACAEPIMLSAKICKHCHERIDDHGGVIAIERKKSIKESDAYKRVFWAIAILLMLIFILPVLFQHMGNS